MLHIADLSATAGPPEGIPFLMPPYEFCASLQKQWHLHTRLKVVAKKNGGGLKKAA